MIRELLTYLSESPTLKEARAFGHLAESISLLSREKRCQKSWATHRAQCKHFIADELKNARDYNAVLVLGSGPLHEIPIELLARTFKKVVLVDVVHLKVTKQSLAHFPNIEFIEHEITEVEAVLRTEGELVNRIPEKFLNEDWGLVLSVNLMSQLPIHFKTYLEKKMKNTFSKDDIEGFLQGLTKNHLEYLKAFKTPVLLITDTVTEYYDKNEVVIQKDENYNHLSMPKPREVWIWNLAPIPEFRKDIGIRMNVSGF
ncbi:MAG: hypothetical protein K2Q18_19575, partial [Bdellovibrionales bacterium]|nr:hypothetical protein [Bdellovibrionales bacterium]